MRRGIAALLNRGVRMGDGVGQPKGGAELRKRGLDRERRASAGRHRACLVGLAALGAWAWFTRGNEEQTRDGRLWVALVLATMLSLVLVVILMLGIEREAEEALRAPEAKPRDFYGWAARWGWCVLLLGAAHAVALAIEAFARDPGPWHDIGKVLAGVCIGLSVVAGIFALLFPRDRPPREREPGMDLPRLAQGGYDDQGKRLVVACSGGGIRASAFVLGGINALQARADELHPTSDGPNTPKTDPATEFPEPHFVAVSGGSYIAASMALARVWEAVRPPTPGGRWRAERRAQPLGWREVYRAGTPELSRLRRHTRDLFEPTRELTNGLMGLVGGAVLNFFMVVAALRFAAWLGWWLASTSGVLSYAEVPLEGATRHGKVNRGTFSFLAGLDMHDWWQPWNWSGTQAVVGITAVLLLGSVYCTLRLWLVQRRRDDSDMLATGAKTRRLRPVLVGAAAGWAVLTLALPGAVWGVSHAAQENQPTAIVAKVLDQFNFTTGPLCVKAAGDSVVDAAASASADAVISPGEKRAYKAGACGVSTDVTLSLTRAATNTCPGTGPNATACEVRSQGDWQGLGADLVLSGRGEQRGGIGGQLAGAATIIAAIAGLVRKASATDSGEVHSWKATLRRLLFAWLPLAAALVLGLGFLLQWTFQSTVNQASSAAPYQVLYPIIALGCAIWLDANVTSLHSFYRQRLSSAFAVGRVRGKPDGAEELDPDRAYKYSGLNQPGDEQALGLSIATTANIRAYTDVPTRRGGVPMVFDPRNVTLQAPGGRVAMANFENSAGLGRTTVMATVAMSGAAVSPLAGRYASVVAPYRLLLTLLNVRVGMWVRNPIWALPNSPERKAPKIWEILRGWPNTQWLLWRPGSAQVLIEAAGRSSLADRWIYLSDGGHLDNTGLVEAVRLLGRQQKDSEGNVRVSYRGDVVVIDASNDPAGTWSAVGDALAVVHADLGLALRRVQGESVTVAPVVPAPADSTRRGRVAGWHRRRSTPPEPPAPREYTRRYEDPTGPVRVIVVKAVRPPSLETADLPDSVLAFAATHTDFPRSATTRQDFGDLEFEAYRMLGEWATGQALRDWGPMPPTSDEGMPEQSPPLPPAAPSESPLESPLESPFESPFESPSESPLESPAAGQDPHSSGEPRPKGSAALLLDVALVLLRLRRRRDVESRE